MCFISKRNSSCKHWQRHQEKEFKEVSLQDVYSFMRSKELCNDCLTTGLMTRKSRNWLFNPFVVVIIQFSKIQNSQITRKSTFTLFLHLLIDQTNVRHFKDSSTSVLVMIHVLETVANLCDGNNPSEIKAERQQLLWYPMWFWHGKLYSENWMKQICASGKKYDITLNTFGESYQLHSH